MKRKTIFISIAILILIGLLSAGTGLFIRAGQRGEAALEVLEHAYDTTPKLGDLVNLAVKCYLPWGQDMPEAVFIANEGIVQQGDIKVKTTGRTLAGRHKIIQIPIRSYRTGNLAPGKVELTIERNLYNRGARKITLSAEPAKINFTAGKIENPDQLPLAGKLTPAERSIRSYFYLTSAVIVVLIILLLLIFWLARRKSATRNIVLPPWVIARKNLAELRKTAEANRQPLEWCVARLSDVVREYLSVRFGWSVKQQTTEEFFAGLKRKRSPLSESQTFYLEEFMKQSDLIKFANVKPDKAAFAQAVNRAEDLVDQTGGQQENQADNNTEETV
ncbi:MAG: hypothetical protein IKA65_09590 [Lentisphaeria bacterium]|nr:hypothetical protein [Lentisphaeria bacterium]